MRRHYLVAYDVADDKRRTAVFKIMMGHGDHVQYSVFLCQLNDVELERLKGRLRKVLNQRDDQAILLNLGPAGSELTQRLECIGRGYTPAPRVTVF